LRIDIQKIDSVMAKLQELRRLATDPDLAPFVDTEDTSNAASAKNVDLNAGVSSKEEVPEKRTTRSGDRKRGDVKRAVIAAVRRSSGPFNGYDLTDQMEKAGFAFVAKNPAITVNEVLRSLVGSEVEIVQPGKGSSPTIYQKVERYETAKMG
jgi:hypothetical protein